VQNALDHAFTNQTTGNISISLGHGPQELIILVRDNGVGLATGADPGLGMEIVQVLVGEELRGTIRFIPGDPGTEVVIRVPRSVEALRSG
jgi:two-component sensor histidine kinase